MSDHNVYEFPIKKEFLNKKEAESIAERRGEKGVVITFCECCGETIIIPFGPIGDRDLLWAAEQLRKFALDDAEDV